MVDTVIVSVVAVIAVTLFAAAIVKLMVRHAKDRSRNHSKRLSGEFTLDHLIVHVDPPCTKARRRSSADIYAQLFSIEDLDNDVDRYHRLSSAVRPIVANELSKNFEIRPLVQELDTISADSALVSPVEAQFVSISLSDEQDMLPRGRHRSVATVGEPTLSLSTGSESNGTTSPRETTRDVLHVSVTPDQSGCLGVILGASTSSDSSGHCDSGDQSAFADCGGVIVKRLLPGGAGWLSQSLAVGDELLCVNGKSVQGLTTAEAVKYISKVNGECDETHREVKFVVRRRLDQQ